MIRRIDRMGNFPGADMTGGAIAAADRHPDLQVRNGRMAEGAIVIVRSGHRRIGGRPRIVTGQA